MSVSFKRLRQRSCCGGWGVTCLVMACCLSAGACRGTFLDPWTGDLIEGNLGGSLPLANTQDAGRLMERLETASFEEWRLAYTTFSNLPVQSEYRQAFSQTAELSQSMGGPSAMGTDPRQLSMERRGAMLKQLIDDRILIDPGYATRVAWNYLLFEWSSRVPDSLAEDFLVLLGESDDAQVRIVHRAFEEVMRVAGAQPIRHGLGEVFDPGLCGLGTRCRYQAGAQISDKLYRELEEWWQGSGASDLAKAQAYRSFLWDTMSAFWSDDPPLEHRARAMKVARMFTGSVAEIKGFLASGSPLKQEAALRALATSRLPGSTVAEKSEFLPLVLRLASADDQLVAANALIALRHLSPSAAGRRAASIMRERPDDWWLMWHALGTIEVLGVWEEDMRPLLQNISEGKDEALSGMAQFILTKGKGDSENSH